jgi:hypothetical protein
MIPPVLAAFAAKISLKGFLLVVGAVVLFSAGGLANGYRWGEKYNAREIEIRDERLKQKEELEREWTEVQRLQLLYVDLNKESYDDLHKRLDALSATVERYGTRTVRVCGTRQTAPTYVVAPSAASGIDAAPSDGLRRTVESDSGPGGDSEGYDIYPEVTALMVEADINAITCNGLIKWQEQVQTLVGPQR